MSSIPVTETISQFIVNSSFEDFPKEVVEAAKRSLLDWISVTLGGSKETVARILVDHTEEMGGKEQATILGYGIKTNILNTAFVNGTMSHILDYDDAHSETRNHTSAPLFPAVLAIAEYGELGGRELLTAYIIGYDVSTRIGLALGKGYYEGGWHATSILGRFGAAVGTCKLLRLKTEQIMHALGLAATQTGGIRGAFGTMGKPFHAGKASMDGLLSAKLAQRGFTGPNGIFEHDSEYIRLFSKEYEPGHIIKGLGQNYHILNNSFKLYAACLLLHPVIDGLISIKGEYNPSLEMIDGIELEVAPLCLAVTNRPKVMNGFEAKFSLQFCSAVAIAKGRVGTREFAEELLKDACITKLMQKVEVKTNASLKETEANIMVRMSMGSNHSRHVSSPKGDPRNPLTFDDLLEKFRDLNHGSISEDKIEDIRGILLNLENIPNISRLVDLSSVHEQIEIKGK